MPFVHMVDKLHAIGKKAMESQSGDVEYTTEDDMIEGVACSLGELEAKFEAMAAAPGYPADGMPSGAGPLTAAAGRPSGAVPLTAAAGGPPGAVSLTAAAGGPSGAVPLTAASGGPSWGVAAAAPSALSKYWAFMRRNNAPGDEDQANTLVR